MLTELPTPKPLETPGDEAWSAEEIAVCRLKPGRCFCGQHKEREAAYERLCRFVADPGEEDDCATHFKAGRTCRRERRS